MIIVIDCKGEPVQEFSALYVNEKTGELVDVFHRYVQYPFYPDVDSFSRQHVHGLDYDFLSRHGLNSENELLTLFYHWLRDHPFEQIYAHAPAKEKKLLSLSIKDVCLKPWKDRIFYKSHQKALSMKLKHVPICNVTCHAHSSFKGWKSKDCHALSATDAAKMTFSYHCSLYDCVECALFLFSLPL